MRIPIAIEIGEKWLKLVGLRPSQIQTFLYYKIKPLTALADEQIATMINDILQQLKIKPKSIVVSFPRNRVTVRNLHLPSQDTQEIIQMIDLNTVRIVPYHKEEIISSYQILGTDEIGYAKLILAIIHKNSAERLLQTLEKAGLFIDKIFLSSYGAREWILFNHKSEIKPNGAYLLLDIDSEFTDFIIFDSDNLLFTRSITIGSGELTKQDEITKFTGEVRQSLVIFQNEERSKNITKLFLSGAAGSIEDLGTLLGKELEMPIVTTPSPFVHEKFKLLNKEVNDTVSLSALTSFLLKEDSKRISFLLPEIQIRQALKEKTKKLVILGSLGIYLLTLLCGIFLGRVYNNQSYLKKIKGLNSSIKLDIEELPNKLKKITVIKSYLNSRKLPVVFLHELQKAVPEEIAIKSIRVNERDRVVLRCQAVRLSDVFKFVTTLENVKYFKDVQTKYTRKVKLKEREVTDFELDLSLLK